MVSRASSSPYPCGSVYVYLCTHSLLCIVILQPPPPPFYLCNFASGWPHWLWFAMACACFWWVPWCWGGTGTVALPSCCPWLGSWRNPPEFCVQFTDNTCWCFERPLPLPAVTNHPTGLNWSREIFANYCHSYWGYRLYVRIKSNFCEVDFSRGGSSEYNLKFNLCLVKWNWKSHWF